MTRADRFDRMENRAPIPAAQPAPLTENDRRLPYFYTHFNGVKCPTCALDILARAPGEAINMTAHYTAGRLLRCDHCLIWIGPE